VSHELEGAQLLVDGERDLIKLRRRIGKTLSAEGYELDDVQLRDSRLEVGLQLADMLAGAVMDVLEGKPILFDLIQAGVTLKSFAAENSE